MKILKLIHNTIFGTKPGIIIYCGMIIAFLLRDIFWVKNFNTLINWFFIGVYIILLCIGLVIQSIDKELRKIEGKKGVR